MLETRLNARLTQHLSAGLVGSVVFKHSDRFKSGIPDLSVSWVWDTWWLEVKIAEIQNRLKHFRQNQWLTCCRLARTTNRCWYVIYGDVKGVKSTRICHPESITREGMIQGHLLDTPGWDHSAVTNFLLERWKHDHNRS